MGVERNDEPGRGHQCPRSEVDGVAPDHPPQKEIQPLAGAPLRGTREEITDAWTLWNAAVCGRQVGLQRAHRERLESQPDVRCGQVIARHEEPLDGPRFPQYPLQDEQQRDDVASPDPAMHERIERCAMTCRIERPDKRRRPRPHHRQQRFNGLEHAGDTAERQRGGAEADDLAVVRRRVAPDDVNRIGGGVYVIERPVEIVEPWLERRRRTPEPANPRTAGATSGTA